MRLWTIHAKYLDQKGLVALWRESLLAKAVLEGNTTGYVNHPQITRFRKFSDPVKAINKYLSEVCEEAGKRGYSFNKNKCEVVDFSEKIDVTRGQMEYEVEHLRKKLELRDPNLISSLPDDPDVFSIFKIISGDIEWWEKT